jgi:hypothetical protein
MHALEELIVRELLPRTRREVKKGVIDEGLPCNVDLLDTVLEACGIVFGETVLL